MQSIKVFSPKKDWMPKHIFSLYFIYNLKDAKLVTEQSSAIYLFPTCVPLSQQSIVSWLKKWLNVEIVIKSDATVYA